VFAQFANSAAVGACPRSTAQRRTTNPTIIFGSRGGRPLCIRRDSRTSSRFRK
jgi:hypothetical protein